MSIRKRVLVFGFWGLVAGAEACGDDDRSTDVVAAPDLQVGDGVGDGDDMSRSLPNVGLPCVTDGDCGPQDYVCGYPTADGCSAVGHCLAVPHPMCTAVTYACGCDGKPVPNSPCFYVGPYAGGPVVSGTYSSGSCPNVGDGGQ